MIVDRSWTDGPASLIAGWVYIVLCSCVGGAEIGEVKKGVVLVILIPVIVVWWV